MVNNLPTVAASSPSDTLCPNFGAINLSESPAGGAWTGSGITTASTGIFDPSVAGAGNHLLVYTYTDNNGCTNSDSASVIIGEATADFGYIILSDSGAFADSSSGNIISWLWEISDSVTFNQQNISYIFPQDGTYEICLTVTTQYGVNNCTDTECILVNITGLGSKEVFAPLDARVFPVPSLSRKLIIRFNSPDNYQSNFTVYDPLGKQVGSNTVLVQKGSYILDLKGTPPGNYFLHISDKDKVIVKKIVLLKE